MKNNAKNDDQSGQKHDAEKQAPVSKVAKKQAKKKEVEAAPGKSPETPEAPESGKAPEAPKPKKKGTKNDVPPVSLGMTQPGFAALLACEAANPEMTRKQVIENALMLYAQHLAYLPPLQLARIDSDSLMTLAGAAAKWEKSGKEILRKIMLAEYDEEERAKHAGEMEINLKHFRENRLTLCRMAGIPISHGLSSDITIAITGLSKLKKENTSIKTFQSAFDNAILILTAYKPLDAAVDAPKPAKATVNAEELISGSGDAENTDDPEIPEKYDPFEIPLPTEKPNPKSDETTN